MLNVVALDFEDTLAAWNKEAEESKQPSPVKLLHLFGNKFRAINRAKFKRLSGTTADEELEFPFTNLFDALGYERIHDGRVLPNGQILFVDGEVCRSSGLPEVWLIIVDGQRQDGAQVKDERFLKVKGQTNVFQALEDEDADPFKYLTLYDSDNDLGLPNLASGKQVLLEDVVNDQIFSSQDLPRYLLFISKSELRLFERFKWKARRSLVFDFKEIFEANSDASIKAMAVFTHRESLAKDGFALLDTFEENSYKHAYTVSSDLKYALREAIELLGNEVIRSRNEDLEDFSQIDAGDLSLQCLRYMYRLLFLFYIEARPELNYVPNKSETYEFGYSLETLRDSELMELGDDESRDGTYIQQSLNLLFSLIWDGHNVVDPHAKIDEQLSYDYDFSIAPIKSHLFDPARTPLLNDVKLRNVVLQQVIRLMSLTRPGRGRGRISYAHLGINQLGAVYESLLSYKGFIAHDDLYEVKRKEDNYDELNTAYFVTKDDLERFSDDEKVYEHVERIVDGEIKNLKKLKQYPKGTFIYRMAGRSRETSASYYTPESLTKCLVKYSLRELLKDKTADDILHLTVCEPAMGSAAFLNEAVNQLAQAYLEKKQQELQKQIPLQDYATELQRVKMYLADNNVFGVDLNPVAVELAEVSLWLNTISSDGVVPWFGNQLCCGNSLVGARREVFKPEDLFKTVVSDRGDRKIAVWWEKVPNRVLPGAKRNASDIYHFLLPDKAMLDYGDKVIKGMAPDQIKKISKWKKDFFTLLSDDEIKQLQDLSAAVDELWELNVQQQAKLRQKTSNALMVWGQMPPEELENKTVQDKDRILQLEKYSQGLKNSSPYRRLKLAMDYWCALWFWPLNMAEWLPSKDEYLFEMSLILRGKAFRLPNVQVKFQDIGVQTEQDLFLQTQVGNVDVDYLCVHFERLKIVQQLAKEHHFHHWELEFADIFQQRGGFDLILGNPPWIVIEWKEGSFMGDYDPEIVFQKISAADLAEKRSKILKKYDLEDEYINQYCSITGLQNFCGALQNYPLLSGIKTNLYKSFLPQAWMIANKNYVAGFVHPEGVYADPRGGRLRKEIYQRLRYHFQFQNSMFIFADVADRATFSLDIYGKSTKNINFINIANLFQAKTIDACFRSNKNKNVLGIKNDNESWNIDGHQDRIVHIDTNILRLFANIYDSPDTPTLEARLMNLHAVELTDVLKCFEHKDKKISSIGKDYVSLSMWQETGAQKNQIIKRVENYFPENRIEAIISGPHFFLGNPLYKTPRSKCLTKGSYDVIDLLNIPDEYFSRVNYVPYNEDFDAYKSKIHSIKWKNLDSFSDCYKLCFREMIVSANERTLVACIIQKEISHIHTVVSYVFRNVEDLLSAASGAFSLPYDFYVKSTGRGHVLSLFDTMPLLDKSIPMFTRVLALSCLTNGYADLWDEAFEPEMTLEKWTKDDPRLDNNFFASLTDHWQRNCVLRTDYARRQALVELDVLVSRALGMNLEQLQTIYRIQFPVMRQYESDTWYDKNGRIVFTSSKGLVGVGLPRKAIKNDTSFSIKTINRHEENIALGFEDIRNLESGKITQIIQDDTMPNGPIEREIIYEAPFSACNREDDYAQAWKWFDEHGY